jgi:MFS family permease
MATNDIDYLTTHYPEYIKTANKNFKLNFILLVLDSSAFTFALAMLSQDTILPLFISKLTQSSVLIGLVPAIYFLGSYASQLIGAYLANGRARRKSIILKIVIAQRIGILMIALTAQMTHLISPDLSLALFFSSYLLFAVLNGMVSPAYSDFISKHIIRNRGLFFGAMSGLGGVIGFSASMVSRYYLDQFKYPVNFQVLFWLGFISSFISPFIIANFRETPLPVVNQPEPLSQFFKNIPGHIRQQPLFLRYITARSILGLGLMGNSFFAIYALQRFSLSEGNMGLFTMTILLAQSALGFVWGWIGDHFGYKKVLVIAGTFLAAEALLALLAPAAVVFYLIAFLIGGVYSATTISDPNFVYEIAPPHETSRFIGIANTFLAPVAALAPLLGGALVEFSGYPTLFVVILVIAAVSLVITLSLVQEPRGKHQFLG